MKRRSERRITLCGLCDHRPLDERLARRHSLIRIISSHRFPTLLKEETVPFDPAPPLPNRVICLLEAVNDNGPVQRIQAKVVIRKDLPITKTEIEVSALLLDDLAGLAANDNGEQPE